MIRSKAQYYKSIPLFFLLASAATVAVASESPADKNKVRAEARQAVTSASNPSDVISRVAASRADRPERNADRGRGGDHHRGGGDRDRGRGNAGRGDHNRGGDRNHGDHRGGDRNRGTWGNDHRGDNHQADRNRGGWNNGGRNDRWDNGRRGDNWNNGRRGDNWRHDGRRDNDWRHDGRHDRRWDDHRGGHYGHRSWDHGFRGRRAWYDSHWRNGYYYRPGRYLGWIFDVPRFLTIDYSPRYDEYYYGSYYYDRYGDNVEVFLFPVYYNDYVEYVPYAYYDGRLCGRGRMVGSGPNISFHFDF